jgi:hypothetical protein
MAVESCSTGVLREGGRLIKQRRRGRRVGFIRREWRGRGGSSLAKFWQGGGVPMLKHPLDGVAVLRGWGGCARAVGVGSGKERGAQQ